MITSSVLNPITFKDTTRGTLPNEWNRLHENTKNGTFMYKPYCQKFNLNNVVQIRFTSDSATIPVLYAYENGVLHSTRTGTLGRSVVGAEITRYYYYFNITLNSAFNLKKIYFKVVQGSDYLESEPVYTYDMTDDIAKGYIRRVEYTNFDRIDSDLTDYFIDWQSLTTTDKVLYYYVEAQLRELSDKDESEILEGSQSMDIISARLFNGRTLKTGGIPAYMVRKLEASTSLDYFAINEIQYIKEGGVTAETFGNSDLFTCEVKLTEKNAIGINVDNLGFEAMAEKEWVKWDIKADKTADYDIATYDGYDVHEVFIKHSASSSGNPATITLGLALAGSELIDGENGYIDETGKIYSFPVHMLPPATDSRLYFGITGGAGTKVDITVQFIRIKDF